MSDATDPRPKNLSSSKLILWGTIAGSIALSIVSAYETWLGLNDFMPPGFIGAVMAFILTFGVQIILFAISWSIAEHVRDGWRANLWRIAIWLLCAFFSGYFSFYGFFQGTGGRDDDVRASYIQSERGTILSTIDDNLVRTLEEQNQTTLVQSPSYQNWIDQLGEVIDAANGAKSQIEANARAESARLRDVQTELRDKRVQLTNSLGQLSAEVGIAQDKLETLRNEYAALKTRAEELRPTILRLAGERDALQVQFEQESATGVGPRARAVRRDLNTKQAELDGAEAQLASVLDNIERIEPELRQAEELAKAGAVETRRNQLISEIDALDAELQTNDQKLAELAQGVDFNFQGQSAALTTAKSNLEGKDYDAYDTLRDQCSALKQQLTDAGVGQSTAAVSCAQSDVLGTINTLRALQSSIADFRQNCRETQPEIRKVEDSEKYQLDPVIEHLESCVDYEPDTNLKQDLRVDISSMKTGRGDSAQPINQAAVALFKDRQGNAVLSFVFAAIVDLLVLLCALVGKNAGLPESVRAIDKLMGLMRKPTGKAEGVEFVVPIPDDERTMGMLDQVINRLIREGLAEFEGGDDGYEAQLHLKPGARSYLARLRSMEISERTVTGQNKPLDDTPPRGGRRRRPEKPI